LTLASRTVQGASGLQGDAADCGSAAMSVALTVTWWASQCGWPIHDRAPLTPLHDIAKQILLLSLNLRNKKALHKEANRIRYFMSKT